MVARLAKFFSSMKEKEQPDPDEKPAAGAPPSFRSRSSSTAITSSRTRRAISAEENIITFTSSTSRVKSWTSSRPTRCTTKQTQSGRLTELKSHSSVITTKTRIARKITMSSWQMPGPGQNLGKLTDYPGPDSGPLSWSADSKLIAYLQGSESKFSAYSMNRLAVVPVQGGVSRVLTQTLDRGIFVPGFYRRCSVDHLPGRGRPFRICRKSSAVREAQSNV